MTSVYDVFIEAAAHALARPVEGCDHARLADVVYACLCCHGVVRCRTCHLDHLPDLCPACGKPVARDLAVTNQVEHRFESARSPRRRNLIVHGEICTACAIDNDWPQLHNPDDS